MTPAEIVCSLMEPKPDTPEAFFRPGGDGCLSPGGWWVLRWRQYGLSEWLPTFDVCPGIEKLGRLHEVESRLSPERWLDYKHALIGQTPDSTFDMARFRESVHASAESKLRALAKVLESEVSHD